MAHWEEAMTLLTRGRGQALKRYAYLLSGSHAEAADLVQDALVKVFSRPRRNWNTQTCEAYVRKAILNAYLDQTRRRRRWLAALPQLAEQPPASQTAAAELRADLMRLLRELSPRQRACVVLFYYEDRPLSEIADVLGCGVGTVKRHLDDARSRLHERWRATHER